MAKKTRRVKSTPKRILSEDESIRLALEAHQASGDRWLRDFGDRPVANYETGENLGTAREFLANHNRRTRKI